MESFKGDVTLEKLLEGSAAVVIDISAEWCEPCKAMAKVLEELEPQYLGKVKFVNLDITSQAPEFIREMSIRSVPTLLLYKDGKLIAREQGTRNKEKMIESIKKIYDEK